MHHNNATDCALPSTDFTWEEFDALPQAARQAIANFPYRVFLNSTGRDIIKNQGAHAFVDRLQADTPNIIKFSAYNTYGPDHPQAK